MCLRRSSKFSKPTARQRDATAADADADASSVDEREGEDERGGAKTPVLAASVRRLCHGEKGEGRRRRRELFENLDAPRPIGRGLSQCRLRSGAERSGGLTTRRKLPTATITAGGEKEELALH